MLLLPDIQFGGNILSIQKPYTLNGFIITTVEIITGTSMYSRMHGDEIIIKNKNGYHFSICVEDLKLSFKREMEHFILRHGDYACIDEYTGVNWNNFSFSDYINDIIEQCNRIGMEEANSYGCLTNYGYSNSYIDYINELESDLRRQGRLTANNYISSTILPINAFGISALEANRIIYRFDTLSSNSLTQSQKKYIHDYNYKLEYIHHYMPNEDKDTTALFGVELEVAGNDNEPNREKTVKKCIQIMNGSEDDTEDLIYSTSDSTVQIELDTMPCSLEFHKNRMNYKELFKYLDELGYKGHDCDKAGLHIHVDRKYLGKSELVQQLTISKILYIIEKFNDEICVIARRNNDYSKFVGKEEVNKSLDKLYCKYKDTGKRVALNLQHKDTIEFRMFRSTLKYETFLLTIEFVKDIVDYAKSVNIEEIELIQWKDLMDTFSDELKEYYNNRLEKEKNKKGNKSEESTTRVELSGGYGMRATAYTLDELYEAWNAPATTFESLYNCFANISCETRETPELTTEERLQREIKSLKKKINNSNNYMEKKNLQKELNRLQKELKKEKRKNKLNNNTSNTEVR